MRCVVVRALEDLPEESVDGLLAYAARARRGRRAGAGALRRRQGQRRADQAAQARHRDRAQVGRAPPSEFPQFVAGEVKRHGARIDGEAAAVLVQAVGQDLRSLSAAAHQLVSDFPGETIEVERVKKYFGGRAEAKSFAVADAAFSGRRQDALEELRWALDGGTPPVLVTSAFAGGVRGLARYHGAPPRMKEADLAREVGVPPWKLRSLREQSRGWSEAGLARAIRAVAQADADIKGAASDANYTLERLVLTITGLREPR